MRHLYDGINPKAYISQSFNEAIEEYSIDYAYNVGFKLSYGGDFTNKNVKDLRQIEVEPGYYLCFHNTCTDGWLIMYYDSRSGAKAAYKELYDRYFSQDWFWIVKVS